MNRRALLRQIGGATSVGLLGTLAGCSGGGGGGGTTTSSGGEGSTATSSGGATSTSETGQAMGTTSGDTMTTGRGTTGSGAPAVKVVSNDEYGKILVDADGRSLYLFEKDKKDKSTCQGKCAKVWPPLTVNGTPMKGDGVMTSIETISRDDGSTQLTATGHPLYYYAPDKKTGQTTGQGLKQFGAEWYLLAPDGSKIEKEKEKEKEGEGEEEEGEKHETTTSTSGSGSGY